MTMFHIHVVLYLRINDADLIIDPTFIYPPSSTTFSIIFIFSPFKSFPFSRGYCCPRGGEKSTELLIGSVNLDKEVECPGSNGPPSETRLCVGRKDCTAIERHSVISIKATPTLSFLISLVFLFLFLSLINES